MRSLLFVVLLATTASSSARAQAAQAAPVELSREAFVARVLADGPAARALGDRVAVARADARAAGLAPNPSLAWERGAALSGARADETEDAVTLRFPLVVSGRLGLTADAAAAEVASVDLRARWNQAELRRSARWAFDAVLAARARLKVLDEAVSDITELARLVTLRERAGESAGYERSRIELEAALVADERVAAAVENEQAVVVAASLLGVPADALPPLVGELDAEATEPPLSGTGGERSDVQALSSAAAAADLSASAAARRAMPDPTLTLGAQVLDVAEKGRGAGYIIGVEVPLPILDAGGRDAEAARARAQALRAERLTLGASATREQAAARKVYEARRERLVAFRQNVLPRALGLSALASSSWRAGHGDLWVILDAQRAAREARLRSLALALEARNAEADLSLVLGAEE
jgi:cobalt-zinc-cadmium efflux system outer membrane protein